MMACVIILGPVGVHDVAIRRAVDVSDGSSLEIGVTARCKRHVKVLAAHTIVRVRIGGGGFHHVLQPKGT
jgi:hypothetical protein